MYDDNIVNGQINNDNSPADDTRAGANEATNSVYRNNYTTGNGSYNYNTGNTYSRNYAGTPNGYGQQPYSGTGYAAAASSRPAPPKKAKKPMGTGKKILLSIAIGLLFGIFAGVGFFAVKKIGDHISVTTSYSVITPEDTIEGTFGNMPEIPEAQTPPPAEVPEEPAAQEKEDAVVLQEPGEGELHVAELQGQTPTVMDISSVAASVMPAVVSIENKYIETISYYGQQYSQENMASGSGIIVGESEDEILIATNNHVIADSEALKVQFVDGSEAAAALKGTDVDMDLAVIAVSLDDISSVTKGKIAIAKLGDSEALTVGEPAIAIGNALGYGQSVTSGVISALNREMEVENGKKGTFIQTDAAINPGNSGGALLNIYGEVIGINSNKLGGAAIEGMGYAIPISVAKPILADLMLQQTKTKVSEDARGYLGISGISVTPEVSAMYGMPEGVYVSKIYEGTGAEAAGIQDGDVIVKFDGNQIKSMDELQTLLEYYASGDTKSITVMRSNDGTYEPIELTITLGSKQSN